MKGRPPKPAEVHARNGDPGKRRKDRVSHVGGPGVPEMPKGLDRDAKQAWDQLVEVAERILDRGDWPVLEAAATMIGLTRQLRRRRIAADRRVNATMARDLVEPDDDGKNGYTERDRDVDVDRATNQYLALYRAERDAHAEARQHTDRLGLGPVARSRLGLSNDPPAPEPSQVNDPAAENPRARRAAMRAVSGGAS